MTPSETHRQFYLNAAGIRMWYAKRPLPGAAPSHEYQPVDDILQQEPAYSGDTGAGLATQSRRQESIKPAVHRAVDLQSLMTTPTAETREPPLPPHVEPDSAAAAAMEPPVEENHAFIAAHLGIWSTENYLLISQWSDEASERLQDSLAVNVLGALRQAGVKRRHMLHWPVFRNPNIPGNLPDDFREILSRVLSDYQDQSIILLGVLHGEQEKQRQRCLKPALSRVGVDFQYSLAELSATPDHKRDLWAELKSRYSL
jgi:hypothetical protein